MAPTVLIAYHREKREEEDEPASKHQIRPGNGTWSGRRGVGRLNPRREPKFKGNNRDRKLRSNTKLIRRNALARKRKRRGRAERRLVRQSARREITVATHNVRTMVVDGTHGGGRALDGLSVYDPLECDIIGLQETRRSMFSAYDSLRCDIIGWLETRHSEFSAFIQACYLVY